MSMHRYAIAELGGDYARGGAGLALTGLPLILLPLVFAAFLVRTWLRQSSVIEADERGITAHGPFGIRMAWTDLSVFRLRYFSVRRDRQRGWMQLDLRGGGKRLKIESSISGFDGIAALAHGAAIARSLPIDDSSEANLMALGVVAPKGGLAERWGVDPEAREHDPDGTAADRPGG
jgi:hypothetical protein